VGGAAAAPRGPCRGRLAQVCGVRRDEDEFGNGYLNRYEHGDRHSIYKLSTDVATLESIPQFFSFAVALLGVAVTEKRAALAEACVAKCNAYLQHLPAPQAQKALLWICAANPGSGVTVAKLLAWQPTEVLESWEAAGIAAVDEILAQRREWCMSVAANPGQVDTLETLLCVLPTILADDDGLPLELILEIFRWV
jgi:hypothetical protein